MNCVGACYYKEVAIYVFNIADVPRLPPGLYYSAGIDFKELKPGDLGAGEIPIRGPFETQEFAIECAVGEIDQIEKRLDAEESNWEFVEA